MKKRFIVGLTILFMLTVAHAISVHADDSGVGTLDPFKYTGTTITPRNASSSFRIPSLGSSGNPCVIVSSSSGLFATSTCGSGGGGSSATTTIAVSGATVNGPAFTLSTSTATNTLNFTNPSGSNIRLTIPSNIGAFSNDSNFINALTGDATASGPGSAALTLATVNANVGTYGSSTTIPTITTNAKGLITSISTSSTPFLIKTNNLSELTNTSTARTSIGLNNTLQNCAGGQFVSSLSATSTIGCGTPSGSGGGSGTVTTSSATSTGYFPNFVTPSGISLTSNLYQASSSGYIGVGTVTPATTLDVNGDQTFRGNIIAGTDNTYDFGASGATRPRTGYFGTSVVSPLLIGGSGINDDLTFKSTTGNGLAGSSKMSFTVGNNGSVTAMTIAQSGSSPIVTLPGTTIIGATGQLVESASQLLIKETSGQAINLQAGQVNFQTNGGGTTYFSPTQFNITIPNVELILAGNGTATQGIKFTQDTSDMRYLRIRQANGGNQTGFKIFQQNDVTNSNYADLETNASGVDLISASVGAASTTPMRFLIDSTVALTIATSSRIGIGTSAPSSTLHVVGTSRFQGNLGFATSSVSVSTCGTSPSVTGSNNSGIITVGSVAATACTLNFATSTNPWSSVPNCLVTNQSMSVVNAMTYAVTTSTLTISQTGLTGDILNYSCFGNPN